MSGHTPGPWTARQHDIFKWWGVYYQGADGTECLLVGKLKEGNARLIAAAPELLDSLRSVVSDILDYESANNLAPNPGRTHCWDSVARACTVMTKGAFPAGDRNAMPSKES